jgi:hypothetical protein
MGVLRFLWFIFSWSIRILVFVYINFLDVKEAHVAYLHVPLSVLFIIVFFSSFSRRMVY